MVKAEAVARLKSRPKFEGGVQVAADSTEVAGVGKQVKSEEAAVSIDNQVRLTTFSSLLAPWPI